VISSIRQVNDSRRAMRRILRREWSNTNRVEATTVDNRPMIGGSCEQACSSSIDATNSRPAGRSVISPLSHERPRVSADPLFVGRVERICMSTSLEEPL
jgi:hypothetical protein